MTIWAILGGKTAAYMGDEDGDRSTPLLVYWIIYQSDQLEEVGVYWKRDSKKNPASEEKEG